MSGSRRYLCHATDEVLSTNRSAARSLDRPKPTKPPLEPKAERFCGLAPGLRSQGRERNHFASPIGAGFAVSEAWIDGFTIVSVMVFQWFRHGFGSFGVMISAWFRRGPKL